MIRSIRARMNLYYFIPLGIMIIALHLLVHRELRAYLLDKTHAELRQNSALLNEYLKKNVLAGRPPAGFDPALSRSLAAIKKDLLPYRITIILPDGVVAADSDEERPLENHGWRREIVTARKEGSGSSIRRSDTVNRDMLYLAVDTGPYFLRVARLLTDVEAEMAGAERLVTAGSLVLLLLVLGLNLFLSWKLTQPLREMRLFVERYEGGGDPFRMPVAREDELGILQGTLNNMAERIDRLVHIIRFDKQRLENVIGTVTEGLVLIGGSGSVSLVNRVFLSFFPAGTQAVGLPYYRIIDSNDLNERIERTLRERERCELTVELARIEDLFLEVSIIPVEEEAGVLVIMRDITEKRKFEKAKSDFVSNASHELKTPLSIIGGYVETLQADPGPDPETRRNFLVRIMTNLERLNGIVADITSLNRLEEGRRHFRKSGVVLEGLLMLVVENLTPAAERAGIRIDTGGIRLEGCRINGVPQLLESVFYNLVDNAIKYGRQGGLVEISAGWTDRAVRVVIKDDGSGFPPEAAERLFERFYRTDTGRSRALGGTGLGLAIVKHAVQFHGGSVRAESPGPGRGACFTVELPLSPGEAAADPAGLMPPD